MEVRLLGIHADHIWDLPEMGPLEVEFVLALVQDVAEPDAPDDVEVGSDAGHEVPCFGQPDSRMWYYHAMKKETHHHP